MGRARGQSGSIREESNSWYGYYNEYLPDPKTGEAKRKSRCVNLGPRSEISKFEAQQKLRKIIQDSSTVLPNGKPRPDGRITLEQFTRNRWLPTKEPKWRSHVDASGKLVNPGKDAAEQTLRHIFKTFGQTPLADLDSVALQKWLQGLSKQYGDSTIKHARYYLKSILEWAVWEDYLPKNPAKFLELPNTKPVEKATITKDQFIAILKHLDERFSLLVRVAVFCAFRPSELLALRWKNFDPEKGVFTIRETVYRGVLRPFTKTTEQGEANKNLLSAAIPEALVKELNRYRQQNRQAWISKLTGQQMQEFLASRSINCEDKEIEDRWLDEQFIFASARGTVLNKENILHRVFRPIAKKLKLPVFNFQTLRRSAATFSQSKGGVKDVQAQLRHKKADTTFNEYAQTVPESVHTMVNAVYEDLMIKGKGTGAGK
jgi:integrase